MNWSDLNGPAGRQALGGYALVWILSTAYLALSGGDWSFPIVSLLIFGCGFSALGWLLTRKMEAPAVPMNNPRRESLVLLGWLAIYGIVIFGWLYGVFKQAIPPGQTQQLAVLGFKLLVHVVIPTALLLAVGGSIRAMWDTGLQRKGFWTALIVLCGISFGLLTLVSPALEQIGGLKLSPVATLFAISAAWLWISLEAGLCEEFLFRAALQSRLSAWLSSPAAGIVLTSLLFALSHVPGLFLRGTPDTDGYSTDPFQVVAFTIATLSPLSLMLGVLWARSRSLLLVVLVHGAIDALQFTAQFVHIWAG